MQQRRLFAESLSEAMSDVVYALGGPKKVAADLWPAAFESHPEVTARKLSQSLDPERREKLDLHEIEKILMWARAGGVHTGMEYLCHVLSYADPVPVGSEDRMAELQREFIKAGDRMEKMLEEMKRLGVDTRPQAVRRVGT